MYLTEVWKPTRNYHFPLKTEFGKRRSFKYEWLAQFLWLSYSPSLDGAFCLPCVLFSCEAKKGGEKLARLLHKPLDTWTSACRKLKGHESHSDTHKQAVLTASEFKKSIESQSVPVQQQVNQSAGEQIKENRMKLQSILKTVVFCGKQNIALRGHRDDSSHLQTDCNAGNFQKLLEFRVEAGDTVLEEHFRTVPRNATYR